MTSRLKPALIGGAVAAVAIGLSVGAVMLSPSGGMTGHVANAGAIGGSFTMESHDGRIVTDEDLKGTPFAIFFGFTHCPDICPSTLADVGDLIDRLGPDADNIRYFFVTLDPARDTPELLQSYLGYFDPRIVGLRGAPDQLKAIAQAYRVFYERVDTSGSYTLNHTATVFLMGADGRLVSALNYGEPLDLQYKKIKRLAQTPTS